MQIERWVQQSLVLQESSADPLVCCDPSRT